MSHAEENKRISRHWCRTSATLSLRRHDTPLQRRAGGAMGSVFAAFLGVGMRSVFRQGMARRGCRGHFWPDLAPASVDQALIGRDQRDVGIDPQPAVARENLDVEMKMARGAIGVVEIVRYHADFFSLFDTASVQDTVGVHARGVHVHVAKAHVFVGGVDLQGCRLLFQRADQHAVAHGDDGLLVGIAAIGAFAMRRTWRRTDILSLMPKTAGALSDTKTAGFAKIILPWIAGVSANRLIGGQRLVARPAARKGLGVGESRSLLQWKSDLRVSGEVGVAAGNMRAVAGDDIAARAIGEIGRAFCRPLGKSCWNIRARARGLAAGDVQRPEETLGDRGGLAAGEALGESNAVEALDRYHIGNAETCEGVTQVTLADKAAQVGKLRCQGL